MKNNSFFKLTFWKAVGTIIVAAGLYSTYIRFSQGLGASTNLSDEFPWGIWIGFDILSGVCLAAGGFLLCAITHIFNIEKYKPLTHSAILTAFLGYLLVCFGLMFDLGRPWNIWHAIIMWNPKSVMFEVAWCVMLYSSVLFLEFSPLLLKALKWKKLLNIIRKVSLPIMMLGVLLSTLHQSSLGSLFLIFPSKMHALWYTPYLPVFFYLSAIATGFAMVIFEAYLSARAFGKSLELNLLSNLGFFCAIFISILFVLRMLDIITSGKSALLIQPTHETYMFWSEVLISSIVPASILLFKKNRESRKLLYISACLVVAGALFNRLNVSVTSILKSSGYNYFPSVYEISITAMLVVMGMFAFSMAVKYLPIFEDVTETEATATEIISEEA